MTSVAMSKGLIVSFILLFFALPAEQTEAQAPMTRKVLIELQKQVADLPPASRVERYTYVLNHENLSVENKAFILCHRGLAYAAQKEDDAALADFTQSIKYNPNLLDAYVGRSNIWVEQGEHRKALNDLNIIAKRSQSTEYDAPRALVLIQLRRFDQASKLLDTALKKNPADSRLLLIRTMLYDASGQEYKALVDKRILREQSSYWSSVYEELGELQEKSTKKMIPTPEPVKLTADQLQSLFDRARRLFKERQYDETLTLLNLILENESNHMRARLYRARLQLATGKHSKALNDLNVLVNNAPGQPLLYQLRAQANYGASQYDAALGDYQRLLQLNPLSPEALEGIRRLEGEGINGTKVKQF